MGVAPPLPRPQWANKFHVGECKFNALDSDKCSVGCIRCNELEASKEDFNINTFFHDSARTFRLSSLVTLREIKQSFALCFV